MRLKVLGCHGGEMPGHRASCILVNDHMTIDAGSIVSTLSIEKQAKLDNVLVSHSHMDHIKDLALMADLVIGRKKTPINVHVTAATKRILKDHFFNNRLWPDFTTIPTKDSPVVQLIKIKENKVHKIDKYKVTAIQVNHPVDSVGFIIDDGKSTIVYSGDTGPTENIWKEVNKLTTLKAILLEVSFPNNLQELADVSGHFTPYTLSKELEKIKQDVPVLLYHFKPAFIDQVKSEIKKLNNKKLIILNLNDKFEF